MGFAACHPAVNFIFFVLVLAGGMCFAHPWFVAVSLAGALAYFVLLRGRAAWRTLGWMLALAAVAAAANPVFVQRGETVLFTWLAGRVFTREALLYGLASGGMFLAVLLWFGSFNRVMTGDKLQHLFAPIAPAIALVFSMTLRLVPGFSRKASQIAGARRCIGKGAADGTGREKIANGAQVLSALTGWALEGAVETADSMRSRGWGCGVRTRFVLWRFGRREIAFSAAMAAALAVLIAAVAAGGAHMEYYPRVTQLLGGGWTWAGLGAYAVLCFLPSITTIWEEISWRISKSKI